MENRMMQNLHSPTFLPNRQEKTDLNIKKFDCVDLKRKFFKTNVFVQSLPPVFPGMFAVNLQSGPRISPRDNIALHISPHFDGEQSRVVRNALKDQTWGEEEGYGPCPFQPGEKFEVMILAQTDHFKIAFNGLHYAEFAHRLPLVSINSIVVDGDVNLFEVRHQFGKANSRKTSFYNTTSNWNPVPPQQLAPAVPPYPVEQQSQPTPATPNAATAPVYPTPVPVVRWGVDRSRLPPPPVYPGQVPVSQPCGQPPNWTGPSQGEPLAYPTYATVDYPPMPIPGYSPIVNRKKSTSLMRAPGSQGAGDVTSSYVDMDSISMNDCGDQSGQVMQRFALSMENRYLPTAEKAVENCNKCPNMFCSLKNFLHVYLIIKISTAMMVLLVKLRVRITGDGIKSSDRAVILMNHRTRLDWMYFWLALYSIDPKLLISGKIILKSELKSIPGAGWSMQCKNFIFLQRAWEIDRITLKENVDYWSSIDLPFQLLIFPEGTNFCMETKAKSDNFAISNGMQPLEHLLHPRTTGVVYLISELCERGALDTIYDVTVAYPDNLAESETDFVKGNSPEEIHYHIKRYDVQEPWFPRDQKSMIKWVYRLWEEKEQRLMEYFAPNRKANLRNNTFPGCMLYNLTNDKCCLLYAVMVFWLCTLFLVVYFLYTQTVITVLYFTFAIGMFTFIEYTCNGIEKLQSKVWLNRSQLNCTVDMQADYSEQVPFAYHFRWSVDAYQETNVQLLVVAFGVNASEFIRTYASGVGSDSKPILLEIFRNFQSDPIFGGDRPCSVVQFYNLKGAKKTVICCMPEISYEQLSVELAKEIFRPFIDKPKTVVVLTSRHWEQYRFYHNEPIPKEGTNFLRYLKNSFQVETAGNDDAVCVALRGSLISGLPAAVMIWCEEEMVPATLFVAYTASSYESVAGVKCFEPIMKLHEMNHLFPEVNKEAIQKLFERLTLSSGNVL
ncbi:Lysocardiolipin acyltransferase 1 [Trichinella nativa]|uniref:Lysocardiolipin acyltransferase 1 n=1 Tax=Trichinella nativa TaxID=6335 RepID=A0A0V1LKN5_9BILA|nr:Lysocardiolipin acyltransferase 1 [Trichinella nativa]